MAAHGLVKFDCAGNQVALPKLILEPTVGIITGTAGAAAGMAKAYTSQRSRAGGAASAAATDSMCRLPHDDQIRQTRALSMH